MKVVSCSLFSPFQVISGLLPCFFLVIPILFSTETYNSLIYLHTLSSQ